MEVLAIGLALVGMATTTPTQPSELLRRDQLELAQASKRVEKRKLAFVGAFDLSGQDDPGVTRALASSLARTKRFTFIPPETWAAAAEAAGAEGIGSTKNPAMTEVAGAVGASAVLVAIVIGGDALATRIELEARDPVTGKLFASERLQVSIDFGAGASSIRLTRQQADRLALAVLRRLPPLKAPPPPPKGSASSSTNTSGDGGAGGGAIAGVTGTGTGTSASGTNTGTSAGASGALATGADGAGAATGGGGGGGASVGAGPGLGNTDPADSGDRVEAPAEAPPTLESLILQAPEIKIGANVIFAEWIYLQDAPGKVPARHEVTGALQLTATTGLYTAQVRLLARNDFGDATRKRLEAEEAWVEVGYWGLRLRAGRNIVVWDPFINTLSAPGSPISPTDERDFIRSESLPINNVRLAYDLGALTFEAWYLPVPERTLGSFEPFTFERGRFVNPARWYTDGSTEAGIFGAATPARVVFQGAGPGGVILAAPPTLQNAQGAARVFADFTSLRLSLAYGYLVSLSPTFVAGAPNAEGTVTVTATYPRFHLVHFAGAYNIGILSTGLDLQLTASPDVVSSFNARTTATIGLSSAPLAEEHRVGGGLVLINKANVVPTLVNDFANTATNTALDSIIGGYAFYGYSRLELITIFVQASVRAPNFGNLTQLSLKLGPITTLVGVSSAWGFRGTLFGDLSTINRVELAAKASL